ncbi:MAG: cytochrome C [Methylibium sp. NZG]|nr:MAG: cytochrome C [Methylibium sp. NZG]
MHAWLRGSLIAATVLATAAAGAAGFGLYRAEYKLDRRVEVPARAVAVPTGSAAVDRGRYLFTTRGCAECHGADAAGRFFIDDGGLRVRAPNISPGAGTVVANYRTEDWVRTLRHGVKPDGRPVFIMPSEDYSRWTDADAGALIAYMRQMPPAPGGGMVAELPLPVRLAYGLGVLKDAAEKIDHQLPPPAPVPEGVNVAHGAYVAQTCVGCHGAGLGGGKIPGAPPAWPAAANLTPGAGSVMPRYADAETFAAMMRSGRRPDGSAISTEMPFSAFSAMSDVDLQAMHLYLQSAPPRAFGER